MFASPLSRYDMQPVFTSVTHPSPNIVEQMMRNGAGDATHPYSGAWHAAQTKVPSESNLLYLPLPVQTQEVSNSTVDRTLA